MRNKQIKISESTFAALKKKKKQNYVLDTVTKNHSTLLN